MVVGSYPCCDGPLALSVPDKCPAFIEEVCPHCGRTVWHRLSRIDPESWLEEDFLKVYSINRDTMIVERFDGRDP